MSLLTRLRISEFLEGAQAVRTVHEGQGGKPGSVENNKRVHLNNFREEPGTGNLPPWSRQENLQIPADLRRPEQSTFYIIKIDKLPESDSASLIKQNQTLTLERNA